MKIVEPACTVILNSSLPFNEYAYLATHNSFAIKGKHTRIGKPRITVPNQEDSITEQLNNGVRVLMLDTYNFKGDIWLCHSFGGKCHDFTAYEPAIETLKEVEAFLSANPSEIITIILEDYVSTRNGLTKVFNASGLMNYWFPVSDMPRSGQDWPLVETMVSKNHRLIVFTSDKTKQASEGIDYQWNYMVENQYGRHGMHSGSCENRQESAPLTDKTKSLVLLNHFRSIPVTELACVDNSADLINMLDTCYSATGNRWANFVAVDYYKRSDRGGAFQAVDKLNGKLLCRSDDVHACAYGQPPPELPPYEDPPPESPPSGEPPPSPEFPPYEEPSPPPEFPPYYEPPPPEYPSYDEPPPSSPPVVNIP
ncbi:PLC-like phosphodiesterase [Parasponia andersonii]|uniref:PLC-like phosphodiesterase n=1 Tax=Parasponia andersonii TaxID=3476 RepID=A0A2P5E2G0_PARAD|nr:PLC-like phosphodiesterase [Parasponia andersonii]